MNFDRFDIQKKNIDEVPNYEELEDGDIDDKEWKERSKENIQLLLPDEAVFLGSLIKEVENWGTYEYAYDYYIMPCSENGFNWALFRLYWDDNWGNWKVSGDVRCLANQSDYREIAKSMIIALWHEWGVDTSDLIHNDFIEKLMK